MITTPLERAAGPPRRRPAVRDHNGDAPECERPLLIHYHEHGDTAARESLVEQFMPLAGQLARRFVDTGEPLDDLRQVAAVGLLKAIDRFDPARGTKFTSYAAPTILGELKRHLRDTGWAVHVPRALQERAVAVSRETEALTTRLGRSPTPRELATAIGCAVEELLEAQEAATSYTAASLDAPVLDAEETVGMVELLGADDASYALVDERDAISRGMRSLAAIERDVLRLRFAKDLSQREIGERVGCSQMQVSRLLRRALAKLKAAATPG
jgi:RNA polymerase sigma-B factor